jgi:hypothetical protein
MARTEDLGDKKWVELKRIIDDEDLEVNKNVGGPKARTLDDIRADIRKARTTIDKSDAVPSAASAQQANGSRPAAVRPPTPAQAPIGTYRPRHLYTAEGVRPAPATSSLTVFAVFCAAEQ